MSLIYYFVGYLSDIVYSNLSCKYSSQLLGGCIPFKLQFYCLGRFVNYQLTKKYLKVDGMVRGAQM